MKAAVALLIGVLVTLGGVSGALAVNLKDKVKADVERVDLQRGMELGTYACAAGHLHIRGTVQNLADVTLGEIKVAGKAFGSHDRLLGTAISSTRQPILAPGEKTPIDLEFLTVRGSLIRQVKKYELAVVEAPTAR